MSLQIRSDQAQRWQKAGWLYAGSYQLLRISFQLIEKVSHQRLPPSTCFSASGSSDTFAYSFTLGVVLENPWRLSSDKIGGSYVDGCFFLASITDSSPLSADQILTTSSPTDLQRDRQCCSVRSIPEVCSSIKTSISAALSFTFVSGRT